jgi:hypothetical protein
MMDDDRFKASARGTALTPREQVVVERLSLIAFGCGGQPSANDWPQVLVTCDLATCPSGQSYQAATQ